MVKICFAVCFALSFISNGFSQNVLTLEDAISKALKNSKNITAAGLAVLQQKQLLKSSFNLPNPEVFIESPTGIFYTGSITQSIEFPSVYKKQYQLQQQQIVLADKEKQLTEGEVKLQTSRLYLLLQYNVALQQYLHVQDTIFERLSKAAGRQFDAGQIDYLQKTLAESQYGEIHNQTSQYRLAIANVQNQLKYLIGVPAAFNVNPLDTNLAISDGIVAGDSTAFTNNPSLLIINQEGIIAQKNIELQKAKSLPGLAFGYFNQGERSTPIGNRFRLGFTVPLWFGQFRSSINAAKTNAEVMRQKAIGLQQQLSLTFLQAQNELDIYSQSIRYYKSTGIPKAQVMVETARRFFESGEIDYVAYLRNLNEAQSINLKYLEVVRNYSQALVELKYLNGTL